MLETTPPSTTLHSTSPWQMSLSQKIFPEINHNDGSLQWGRLIAEWNEKTPQGKILTHTYAASVDGETGGLYIDCNIPLIFRKCLCQLVVRPLHIIAKTVYHASMIPLFIDLPNLFKGKKSLHDFLYTSLNNLTDIIRTPLYGLTIIAASIYVLARGIFDPTTLYDGRKLIGEIEQEANRGFIHTNWTLTKCFQPFPMKVLADYEMQEFSHDTSYPSKNPVDRQLANFARSRIRHKQKYFDIFSCSQLPKGQTYTSEILLYENRSASEKSLPIYANIL